MPIRRSTRAHATLTSASSPPKSKVGRPRRTVSGSTVEVMRDDSKSPDDPKKALRLTMKMPSSKLREATSNPRSRPGSRGNAISKLTDSLTGGEIVSGPRASRANKKYVVESESDEDESDGEEEDDIQPSEEDQEDEEEDEVEDDEEEQIGGPEESDEEDAEGEDEEDAEGEVDAEGDIEMGNDDNAPLILPPQPILKVKGPAPKPAPKPSTKPTVTVTPAQADKLKSVEAKEMEMDDDDEELSDLSEDDDGGEEDAEGDLDEEMGEDDESRSPGSRGSTPDVRKMTNRQKSKLDQDMSNTFLQLPMGNNISDSTPDTSIANPIFQNLKRKNTSRQKSTPCAEPKWPGDVRI